VTSKYLLTVSVALGGLVFYGIISFALAVGVLREYLRGGNSRVDRAQSI